jgi:hypothetical protein
VEHLERAGYVGMKRPPNIGAAALGRFLRADSRGDKTIRTSGQTS